MLICPKCKKKLIRSESGWNCSAHHHYDEASSGYVNLLLQNSAKAHGDNSEMILARRRFLAAGHYKPLLDKIIEVLKEESFSTAVDCGCGEGYYTNALSKEFHKAQWLGLDLSKSAINLASKTRSEVFYAIASTAECPIQSESADLVLNIFSPIFEKELSRIVSLTGRIILVSPDEDHLLEMKEVLYPTVHLNPLPKFDFTKLCIEKTEHVSFIMKINTQEALSDLLKMTPYAYHTPIEGINRYNELSHIEVRASFRITILRKNIL